MISQLSHEFLYFPSPSLPHPMCWINCVKIQLETNKSITKHWEGFIQITPLLYACTPTPRFTGMLTLQTWRNHILHHALQSKAAKAAGRWTKGLIQLNRWAKIPSKLRDKSQSCSGYELRFQGPEIILSLSLLLFLSLFNRNLEIWNCHIGTPQWSI